MVQSVLEFIDTEQGDKMNTKLKINPIDLKYRSIKEKERMLFFDYAFESVRDFAENVIGINFESLEKMCKINRVLLGLPFKIFASNVKDFFIEYEDEIVAGYTIIYDKKKDAYELGNLFTKPEFQGRGIGNIVIQKIIDEYGHKTIKLSVDNFNEAALHLYRKYGFKEDYSTKEYFQEIPLEIDLYPDDFHVRLATKEDIERLDRINNEIPDLRDLKKNYKKSLGKTENKKLRLQNFLPAVIEKNGEILGIGRAIWSKGAPKTAMIAAIAILPEAKEAYPLLISFLTKEAEQYGLEKFSWSHTQKTDIFAEYLEPYLNEPARIGYEMSRTL
ncbi:MAG: GNAT family N-acetyltransferase [Candidatus Heimdallarchaeaceae archaeon]